MNTDKIFAKAIANEYAPKDTSKVVALQKLDRRAKLPANIFAYSFGAGMTLVLGLVGVSVNYPVYKKLFCAGKEKYAFEIVQLPREISVEVE